MFNKKVNEAWDWGKTWKERYELAYNDLMALKKEMEVVERKKDYYAYEREQQCQKSALGRFRYSLLVRLAAKYDLTFVVKCCSDVWNTTYHVFYKGEQQIYVGEVLEKYKHITGTAHLFTQSILNGDELEFSEYLLFWNKRLTEITKQNIEANADYKKLLKEI
jgi:hypothetical protein